MDARGMTNDRLVMILFEVCKKLRIAPPTRFADAAAFKAHILHGLFLADPIRQDSALGWLQLAVKKAAAGRIPEAVECTKRVLELGS